MSPEDYEQEIAKLEAEIEERDKRISTLLQQIFKLEHSNTVLAEGYHRLDAENKDLREALKEAIEYHRGFRDRARKLLLEP